MSNQSNARSSLEFHNKLLSARKEGSLPVILHEIVDGCLQEASRYGSHIKELCLTNIKLLQLIRAICNDVINGRFSRDEAMAILAKYDLNDEKDQNS